MLHNNFSLVSPRKQQKFLTTAKKTYLCTQEKDSCVVNLLHKKALIKKKEEKLHIFVREKQKKIKNEGDDTANESRMAQTKNIPDTILSKKEL